MAPISILFRNRSKSAKHISDFVLVLKDLLVNNAGLNKDALFRFREAEVVLMQASENWLRCQESSCFILCQPHRDTYAVSGATEAEACYLVRYGNLVRLLDPIRKSLATLRLVFAEREVEVEAVLAGGSRLHFAVDSSRVADPPRLDVDFRRLTRVAELSPAMSKVLCAKPRLYHMLLLPESLEFQEFTGSRLTRSEKVKPAQLASYHYERLMAELDERPMVLMNSSFFSKHLQFCQRVGNPPVEIYLKPDARDQLVIKIETDRMVLIKNFGCQLADVLGARPPLEKAEFKRTLKRPEGELQLEADPGVQPGRPTQEPSRVKQQHFATHVPAPEGPVAVQDSQQMEPIPYHLMLLKVRKAEEQAREAANSKPPLELADSQGESEDEAADSQWEKYKREPDDPDRQAYHRQF